MGWFSHDHADLLAELRKKDGGAIDAELHRERDKLEKETNELRRELNANKITASGQREEFDRRERELRHMIGLEQKRQVFEVDAAKRDALLTVREENLKADRERFETQMKFQTDRFESELKAERELMREILGRLPTVTVDKHVATSSHVGGPIRTGR
jgi:hypothetical protein